MAYKRWIISGADKDKASELSEKFNIDPFIALMLVSRGIESDGEVSDFLASSYDFSDPFLFADMDKAVERIEQAFENEEKVTVFGDYDCDGVTSTVMLYSFLKDMGIDVDYYIPSRLDEGYGMNKCAIDKLYENGTRLIITVDNGITANDEAEYIYSLGMELIVTDHHQLGESLPKAYAVVNPHRSDNKAEFTDFSGVGVVFKLLCAVYGDVDDVLYNFADLVTLGTIADVMPLVKENRAIVKVGIDMINSGARKGIVALKKLSGVNDKILTATDVAFSLCPRINAAGRVDDANRAVELLLADNDETACCKAELLNIDNAHRQEIEQNITNDIRRQLASNNKLAQSRVIVVSGKGYHLGVVGICAAKILEEYGKPVIVLSDNDDGTASGSARSVDGFNIFEAISSCCDILLHFGGHPKAAGMGLKVENIDLFRNRINEYSLEHYPVMPVQSFKVDFKISPSSLSTELVDTLCTLEPFGEKNPPALFAIVNLKINSIASIGNGNHIRFECEKNGVRLKIVKFGCCEYDFPFAVGENIDVLVRISKNHYNGREYLSVKAEDIKRHGNDDNKYFFEKEEYELFLLKKNNSQSVYPSRDIFTVIYKFLRMKGKWHYGFDELYFAIKNVTYGQLKFALKAFEQSGLIIYNGNDIEVKNVSEKVDLMDTPIMKLLKGRLSLD